MKKEYIKPEVKEIVMNEEQILAGSNTLYYSDDSYADPDEEVM